MPSSANTMASVAPQVTVTCVIGSMAMWYQSWYFAANAFRSRAAPQVMAYWLMSSRIARAAASFRTSGQGKLGKPCERLMAPCSLASRVIPRITDSVKPCVRRAVRAVMGQRYRLLLQEQLRDRIELHVARAFVDRSDLRISVELLDRILLRVAVAAKELDRERCHPLGDLRAQQLRHRRFLGIRLACVLEPGGVVNHQPRRLELRRRLRQLELHALKIRHRLAELLPLLHVFELRLQRAPRHPDHLRAAAD